MGVRPGRTMRKLTRPYTRISHKVPRKSFVVGVPTPRIRIFEMGDPKGKYDVVLHLIAQKAVQIRHNALEAARIDANKFVSKRLGKNYFFKILVYPFQVLREKPIAMGAGADRFSQGMRLAFGKPVGTAVRTRPGQRLMSLWVKKEDVEVARKALKRAGFKLPTPVRIEVEEL